MLVATPSYAQQPLCLPWPRMANLLSDKHNESQVWFGRADATHLLELWNDKEDGSWTLLVVDGNDKACIFRAGSGGETTDGLTGKPV